MPERKRTIKKSKNRKKYFGIVIILLFYLAGIGTAIGIYIYQKPENEEERSPYFTKYHLTEHEMRILDFYFAVDSEPSYKEEYGENKGLDFSYIELKPTEGTEKRIEFVNYFLFDCFYADDIAGKDYAEKCGLSYGNRMTLEWFMAHPAETVEIVERTSVLENELYLFVDDKWIYEMLSKDLFYTQYEMSYRELMSASNWFEMDIVPEMYVIYNRFESGESDFSDVALQKTEYTEKAAVVMSWLIFDQCADEDAAARKKAAEYGLSKENPITTDWIATHPKEAIEIKNLMEGYGEILYHPDEMRKIYEKVNRKGVKDVVQWFGELCKETNGIEAEYTGQ